MGYIYKITSPLIEGVYIGQTKNEIDGRFHVHKQAIGNYKLSRVMRKYGASNFICEKIESCPNEFLNRREKFWINYYNSYYNGWNTRRGNEDKSNNTYVSLDISRERYEKAYQEAIK